MKKIALFTSVLALCATAFTSCNKDKGPDFSKVTEDGFYVTGLATGADKIAPEYMMAAGKNEVDKQKRSGMFEKYVALKGGTDFELILYSAGEKTRYSATLEDLELDGTDDTPKLTILRGELKTGSEAPAMQVAEDGLYHIVLDLNTDEAAPLEFAQIIVAPVTWGIRGINDGSWTYVPMTVGDFNLKTMTWTQEYENGITPGKFKFSYGGWKIPLDLAGTVKAETNLGAGMESGGGDIEINKKYNNGATVILTWTLKGGDIKNSYKWELQGTVSEPVDPATCEVGFSGTAFLGHSWGDVYTATYDADASEIDATTKAGTAVYKLTDAKLIGGEFKARFNGGYKGVGEAALTGITTTGDGNFVAAESEKGMYDVTFTVGYDGYQMTSMAIAFSNKRDLPTEYINPATLVVGLSGSAFAQGKNADNEDADWVDPQELNNTLAAFSAADSNLDATTYDGTVVYKITGLTMKEGKFKVRFNGGWLGVGQATLTGITTTTDNESNFVIAEDQAGDYDIVFTATYTGLTGAASAITATFTKCADEPQA